MSSSFGALTFRPHLEERVWGGGLLGRYGRELPANTTHPIGESWEVSAIPGRSSVVTQGRFEGRDLESILAEHRQDIVGRPLHAEVWESVFPLLLKLLDSATPLSVQLHPNDAEAHRLEGVGEGKLGKTEAWVVLHAEPGSEVIHGLAPGVEPAEFFRRMAEVGGGKLPAEEERSWFRWVEVRPGDVVFVPAGTIHALGAGVILAEVQQNSDITYRIYDWGRQDSSGNTRDLHIDKAREVQLPADTACPLVNVEDLPSSAQAQRVLDCDRFRFDWLSLEKGSSWTGDTRDGSAPGFRLLITWDGHWEYGDAETELALGPVQFVLVPSSCGQFHLRAASERARALIVSESR